MVIVTCWFSVHSRVTPFYWHLNTQWHVFPCCIRITRNLDVDIFPWCTADFGLSQANVGGAPYCKYREFYVLPNNCCSLHQRSFHILDGQCGKHFCSPWGLTSWKLCEIFNRLCVFLASKVSTHSTKSNFDNWVIFGAYWSIASKDSSRETPVASEEVTQIITD